MRYRDLLCESEYEDHVKEEIVNQLVVYKATDKNSVPIQDIIQGLIDIHVDVDAATVYDILEDLPIVDHMDDETVYLTPEEETKFEDKPRDKEVDDVEHVMNMANRAAKKDRSLS